MQADLKPRGGGGEHWCALSWCVQWPCSPCCCSLMVTQQSVYLLGLLPMGVHRLSCLFDKQCFLSQAGAACAGQFLISFPHGYNNTSRCGSNSRYRCFTIGTPCVFERGRAGSATRLQAAQGVGLHPRCSLLCKKTCWQGWGPGSTLPLGLCYPRGSKPTEWHP